MGDGHWPLTSIGGIGTSWSPTTSAETKVNHRKDLTPRPVCCQHPPRLLEKGGWDGCDAGACPVVERTGRAAADRSPEHRPEWRTHCAATAAGGRRSSQDLERCPCGRHIGRV